MKKTLATIGCLFLATAALGNDGQHTGIGGNPNIPPENTSHSGPPGFVTHMLKTGIELLLPQGDQQDASQGNASTSTPSASGTSDQKTSAE